MSYTRIVAYNTVVQVLGKAVGIVISFFLFRLVARYLGVAGVGEYTTIYAYSNFLAILADLGFQIIIVRALSTIGDRALSTIGDSPLDNSVRGLSPDKNRIVSTIVSMRTVVAVIVFLVGMLIAQLLPYQPIVKLGIVFGAAATFWLSVNSTLVGILQANFRMDKAVLTDLIGKIINFGGVLVVVSLNAGLIAIMAAYIVGNFINLGLSLLMIRHYANVRFHFDWPAWKKYFGQAISFGAILIFAYIYFRIDALILSLMKGSYDVGIYGVPYKILDIILFIPAIFMGVVFPLFARYGAGDRERLKNVFRKTQDILLMAGLPTVLGIIILARPIVNIIGGQEFLSASTITVMAKPVTAVFTLQILMVAVFLSFLSHPYTYVLTANGFQKKLVLPNILYAIFNIGLNIVLIPKYSYLAAAAITVLTEVLVLTIPVILAKRLLGLGGAGRLWLKVLVAGAGMSIIVWYLQDSMIIWPIVAGAVTYFAILWLLKGIDREMMREIFSSKLKAQST